jgi:hypothetical protein
MFVANRASIFNETLRSDRVQARFMSVWMQMKQCAASMMGLLLCLGCQRATSGNAGERAATSSAPHVAQAARPAPAALPSPNTQTQQDPVQETRWIAFRWARELPTFQYESNMCAKYEKSSESRHPPLDVWGTPFRVRCDRSTNLYVFRSAGADQEFETADDILVQRMSDPISTSTGKP